jgi:hypothetical protein
MVMWLVIDVFKPLQGGASAGGDLVPYNFVLMSDMGVPAKYPKYSLLSPCCLSGTRIVGLWLINCCNWPLPVLLRVTVPLRRTFQRQSSLRQTTVGNAENEAGEVATREARLGERGEKEEDLGS